MKTKASKIIIIILAIVAILSIATNVTLALMNNNKVNTGIVQFAQHKLDIDIVGNESIVLSKEEMVGGYNATRTLNIKNPHNSTSCVLRIRLEFKVEGVLDKDYITFIMSEEKFYKDEENAQYYYKDILGSGEAINNLVLNFKITENIPAEYEGKSYSIKLYVESIQATTGSVEAWKEEYPLDWYNLVKDKLNK